MADKEVHVHNHTSGGIGLGAVIAMICSWTANHSILWLILHALCGWFYVLYWVIFC